MRHEQVKLRESFDIVDAAEIWPSAGVGIGAPLSEIQAGFPQASTPAVSDMPVAVGRMMVGVYAGLIGIFLATMARSGEATFMIAISGVYVAMFLSVPRIFFAVEKDSSQRPDLARFMRQGIDTHTGHMSGGSALAQMFAVPLLLAGAVLAMGLVGLWFIR
jgi:hypothetical protein